MVRQISRPLLGGCKSDLVGYQDVVKQIVIGLIVDLNFGQFYGCMGKWLVLLMKFSAEFQQFPQMC